MMIDYDTLSHDVKLFESFWKPKSLYLIPPSRKHSKMVLLEIFPSFDAAFGKAILRKKQTVGELIDEGKFHLKL